MKNFYPKNILSLFLISSLFYILFLFPKYSIFIFVYIYEIHKKLNFHIQIWIPRNLCSNIPKYTPSNQSKLFCHWYSSILFATRGWNLCRWDQDIGKKIGPRGKKSTAITNMLKREAWQEFSLGVENSIHRKILLQYTFLIEDEMPNRSNNIH